MLISITCFLNLTNWIGKNKIIANIDMPGYSFVSIPSLSNAGGVAFYIKITGNIARDLSSQSTLLIFKLYG